jgi:hypothetical protein
MLGIFMIGVTLLKHFTRSLVNLNEKISGFKELGDLPLSISVEGKIRNIEKIELRKYTFTIPDENGNLSPKELHTLVCIPSSPDGEPFITSEENFNKQTKNTKIDFVQARLRGFNYEVIEQVNLEKEA